MMRKKSQGYTQMRYALALPALIGLGFLFAQLRLEAQAPTTQNSTLPPPPPMMAPGAIDKNDNKQAAHSSMATELVVVGQAIKDSIPPGEIFKVVENMPEFPGGQNELMKFLAQNIVYPTAAKKDNIEGLVVVQFIVGKDGSILNPQIVRSIGGGISEEAMRVISMMPNWKPGLQRGQNVNVQFNLPIRFKLDGRNTNQVQLGESTLKVQGFKVSPNPSNGIFNLSFQAERKTTMIEVYSLSGQRVFNQAMNRFDGSYNGQIDLSKQPVGEYVIRITQDGAQYSQKVIKQ